MTWSEWRLIPMPAAKINAPMMNLGLQSQLIWYMPPLRIGSYSHSPMMYALNVLNVIPMSMTAIGILLFPLIIIGKMNDLWK